MTRIDTARLSLIEVEPAHAPALLPLWTDAAVIRFTYVRDIRTVDDCLARLRRQRDWTAANASVGPFVVLRGDSVIGYCGITRHDPAAASYDLFYHFARHAWGQGFASETARALVDHAFASRAASLVTASAVTLNQASWRVLEKVGLQRGATEREAFQNQEGTWDLYRYGLSREDWESRPVG